MRLSLKTWVLFILLGVACGGLWYRFGYPRFAFIELAVSRGQVFSRAEEYLQSLGYHPAEYSRAVLFESDRWADRYLQKTLKLQAAEKFIRDYDFQVFIWRVRFFKELQKEEFILELSPKSGEVLKYWHLIDDIASRPSVEESAARLRAEEFLKRMYRLDLSGYEFHEKKIKRYDKRVDYTFSWSKKGVYIPWGKEEGGAKLLAGATISGDEVREFYKAKLDVPEKFERYIRNQFVFGEYLYSLYFILFISLVGISIALIIKRRDNLIVRLSKRWYFYLGAFFFIVNMAYVFNNMQDIFMDYPTSSKLASFFGLYTIKLMTNSLFLTVMFLIPGISGESLRREAFPRNPASSFLHYLQSTFFSRSVASSVAFGYLLFVILLGFQAVIFYFGQKYMGVWREWLKLTQYSSAYIPALSAFSMAASAALTEEIVFRLFGISLLKKVSRSTVLSVVLMSLLWGFGHSEYAIFPVWFRGVEVSLAGLLLGFVFIRYGLIPVLIAHYLFDVFWGIAAHLIGHTTPSLFIGALSLFIIPLIWALAACIINRPDRERQIKLALDRVQKYNLNMLITFINLKKSQGTAALKAELIAHNWDVALVDMALEEVFGSAPDAPAAEGTF